LAPNGPVTFKIGDVPDSVKVCVLVLDPVSVGAAPVYVSSKDIPRSIAYELILLVNALIKKDYAIASVAIPPVNANSGLTPDRLWPFTEGVAREKQVQVEQTSRLWTALISTLTVGSTIFAVSPIVSGPASTLAFIMLL
jgi:hypothetical protein